MIKETAIEQFGKWVETEAIQIIKDKYGLKEFKQSSDKYSRIDGIIFYNNKLTPVQIKTRSPRILFKDISITKSQLKVYKEIAEKNGKYVCFMICDTYNEALGFDYAVYMFDFGTVKYTESNNTRKNGKELVFIKLADMKKMDILPLRFQQQLEKKHIELIRPIIDKQYVGACHTKFI